MEKPINQPPQPDWCGFNLPEMFVLPEDARWPEMTVSARGRFHEDHFRWIADWGFNFVRLPVSYRYWATPADPFTLNDAALEPIDRAVRWAHEYGLHVSLNLHHAPGYCINEGLRDADTPREPFNLWKDAEALRCFTHHWTALATRYEGVPASVLSFDLVNEPARCTRTEHEHAIRTAVTAIRAASPDRPMVIDGFDAGTLPCPELADLGIVQSCRGYAPAGVSHYRAWWGGDFQEEPSWPFTAPDGTRWDRAALERYYADWVALRRMGVAVHCGEFGAHHATPHRVVLAWLEDLLTVLATAGIGFALWNFHGSFGILDNGRPDAPTRDFHGHRLDHELLALLQRFRPATAARKDETGLLRVAMPRPKRPE